MSNETGNQPEYPKNDDPGRVEEDTERMDTTHPTASYPTAPSAGAVRPAHYPAKFGTILWGVLLLIFAIAVAVTAVPIVVVDTATVFILALIAAGLLLVIAGIAAAVRR